MWSQYCLLKRIATRVYTPTTSMLWVFFFFWIVWGNQKTWRNSTFTQGEHDQKLNTESNLSSVPGKLEPLCGKCYPLYHHAAYLVRFIDLNNSICTILCLLMVSLMCIIMDSLCFHDNFKKMNIKWKNFIFSLHELCCAKLSPKSNQCIWLMTSEIPKTNKRIKH